MQDRKPVKKLYYMFYFAWNGKCKYEIKVTDNMFYFTWNGRNNHFLSCAYHIFKEDKDSLLVIFFFPSRNFMSGQDWVLNFDTGNRDNFFHVICN